LLLSDYIRKTGAKYPIVFAFGALTHGAAKCTFACPSVIPAQPIFVIMIAFFERDGAGKGKKALYVGIPALRIQIDACKDFPY
jgi:hypothetical protein